MDRDPTDLLLPQGMMGATDKPPLRLHPIERELHTISSALGSIAKDIAVLRQMAEREAANGSREHGPGTPHDRLQRP